MNIKPAVPEVGLSPSELKKYTAAVDVYKIRDYEKSARLFESIREQTVNPEMSRIALYGLACSRLMSADSPEAYQEALTLWERWVQCAPRLHEFENPILFAPVVKEKMIFSYFPPGIESANGTPEKDLPAWLLVRTNQELQRTGKQLEEAGKGIDLRDKKIKALEKEISRLTEQISAFEKIDEKIQKKKSATSSAD